MTSGQLLVVRESFASVPLMLEEQGITSDPMVDLRPGLLVGRASDGRTLSGLMAQAKTDEQFDLIVRTQLQDVGRSAEAVARTVEPRATHYVRVLSLPSCGRCVVLAGKPQKSETAFRRHPRCDCTTQPSNGALVGRFATDPRDAFDQMSQAEQDKAMTKAGAEAIRLGADPGKVVNARKGISTAQVLGQRLTTTTAGAARGQVRLMPESCISLATDKADAVRLLRKYGYVL